MERSRSRQLNWPLALWLTAAFISLILSVIIFFLIDQITGLFVATWVPSILAFGALVMRSSAVDELPHNVYDAEVVEGIHMGRQR